MLDDTPRLGLETVMISNNLLLFVYL